jgi:hypothetical protein
MVSTDPEKPSSHASSTSTSDSSSITSAHGSFTLPTDVDRIEHLITPQLSRQPSDILVRKTTSIGTTGSTNPNFEVDWDGEDDPESNAVPLKTSRSLLIGFRSAKLESLVQGTSFVCFELEHSRVSLFTQL